MRRIGLRSLGAALLLILVLPLAGPAAHAAPAGAPMTDFTRITPANAILYATFQSSSAAQMRNLNALSNSAALKNLLNTILNAALSGGVASGTGSGQSGSTPATGGSQIFGLLGGYLGKLVNGQLALAVLPPAQTTAPGSSPSRVHLLFDAGLQPGANLSGLLGGAALFGFPSMAVQPYRGFQITSIDINQLVKFVGTLTKNKQLAGTTLIPKNGILSSIFYGATVGDVAVLASDLPTLQTAIDTYARVEPSIGSTEQFTNTTGLLPMEHFVTLYLHLGADTLASVLGGAGAGALGPFVPLLPLVLGTNGPDLALALTAQPHRLVITSSTDQGVGSQVIGL